MCNTQAMAAVRRATKVAAAAFSRSEAVEEACFARVLNAFRKNGVVINHFAGSSGYAYGDAGRETLERVFADALCAEAALVRPHIASGTHALAVALFGLLEPGEGLVCASGPPYDTLNDVIGIESDARGSLKRMGVGCEIVPLKFDRIDAEAVLKAIENPSAKVVALQRSRGYAWRPSFTVADLGEIISVIKAARPDVIVMVDNCYGEFVEDTEPTSVGADLIVGSLIKNPGGGIAPTGGYVAGKAELVERCAARLYAPGVGGEVGSYEPGYRLFFQGLFMAPHTVRQAVDTASLAAALFEEAGFAVSPKVNDSRTDIIQAIRFDSREALIQFCRAIQASSPVDSMAVPEPWGMPGYADEVIMAAGAFVQGSSIELSADAPLRPPYTAYLQGGLSLAHGKLALCEAFARCVCKLPIVSLDPFYSAENQARLAKSIADAEAGRLTAHELIEED